MKTLFVALVALLIAFFFGCHSSITDPEVSDNTNSFSTVNENTFVYKDAFNFKYPKLVRLEGTLVDPSHRPNGYAYISGFVWYGIREVKDRSVVFNTTEFYKTSPPGTSDKKFKIDLFADADLKGGHNHAWTVTKAAEQTVIINSANQSSTIIQQKFRVKNTCCAPLDLVLKFKVNGKELKLVSMELMLVSGVSQIIDQE